MANQLLTIGNITYDARGRIRTAHTANAGLSLRQRRTWYVDDPAPDDAPPPADDKGGKSKKPPTEAKFTQDDMDAVQGRTRKEAADNARKALLKELGFDPEDAKVLEAVKGKLSVAEQAEKDRAAAEEAKKTEAEKLQGEIETLKKERDAEKQQRLETEAKRIADKVDTRIETLAGKAGAVDPSDVSRWLREHHNADVLALVGEGETIDDAKATALIEKVKAAKKHWFAQARGAGSPSLSGGQTPGMDNKQARDDNWLRARRGH